jgi:hypothetical protein
MQQPITEILSKIVEDKREYSATERITASQLYLLKTEGVALQKEVGPDFAFCPPGRADLAEFRLSFPIDWDDDPLNDRNWRGQLHMWRILDPYLMQHDKTLDATWLEFPLAIIRDWHRYHHTESRLSTYAWKDMMVGLRAMKLAYVMSQAGHGHLQVDTETTKVFDDLVRSHLEFLLDYDNIAYSNHTFFDIHGAAALAQVIDEKMRESVWQVVDQVLPKLIASQFNVDGVHLENSPEYHPFGIKCLKQLENTGWFNAKDLKPLITKAIDFFDWLKMPDGRTLPIGDSNGKEQNLSVKETVFRGKNQVLNRSGYAIIRNDGDGKVSSSSYLALMGALNSRFHKHSDDLSVLWFEGEDILCDAGKYAYKTDEFRAYAVSTRAHNTVEIDGKNYYNGNKIDPELIYGSAIGAVAVHDWCYLTDASVQHIKFGVRHSRFVLYRPGDWLLVIDRLVGEQQHDFTQWFHLAPHLPDLVKRKDGYHTRLRNGKRLRVYSAGSDAVTAILEKGATQPRVQGWISQNYAQMTPNCALGYMQRGQNVAFTTLFSLDDEGSTIILQDPQRLVLKIAMHGKTEIFRISVGEHSCRLRKI